MLNQISNTTILILVIWLSYITTQNSIHLKQIQSKPNTQTQEQISFQKNTLEKLNTLDDFVSKQKQLSQQLNQAQSTLEQYKQQAKLAKTYSNLLTAEILQKDYRLAEASTLLNASKETIWIMGDLYPAHKKKLQGLMQPIDESLQQWQSGNPQSIQQIYQSVQSVLQTMEGN